jgi:formate hydrogenlyase transcriptional activator
MPTTDETLLLHLNEAIATIRDKDSLFKVVTTKLRLIFPFDLIGINVFDETLQYKRLFLRDYYGVDEAPAMPEGLEQFSPIAGTPLEVLVADPRVRQFTPKEYMANYPTYAPYNKFEKLGVTHLTAVPLHIPYAGLAPQPQPHARRRKAAGENWFPHCCCRYQHAGL